MENKFLICKHCGNLVKKINDSGVPLICCGDVMSELVANTSDAAHEKHVPVISLNGNALSVSIGAVEHPMTEEHLIEWVCLQTNLGRQFKALSADSKPVVKFELTDGEEVSSVYVYCNLHGLWKL